MGRSPLPRDAREPATPQPQPSRMEITKEEHARLQELTNSVKFLTNQLNELQNKLTYTNGKLDLYIELVFSKYHLKKEGSFTLKVDGSKYFLELV